MQQYLKKIVVYKNQLSVKIALKCVKSRSGALLGVKMRYFFYFLFLHIFALNRLLFGQTRSQTGRNPWWRNTKAQQEDFIAEISGEGYWSAMVHKIWPNQTNLQSNKSRAISQLIIFVSQFYFNTMLDLRNNMFSETYYNHITIYKLLNITPLPFETETSHQLLI